MSSTLHTDGGARGNPGPAGIGYVLAIPDKPSIEHGEYIGETTNNQAEYQALVAGLTRASQENISEIECFLDSELVVKQVKGEYRIKNAELQPLAAKVHHLAESFTRIAFTHVPREKNKRADALVNKAIDFHKK